MYNVVVINNKSAFYGNSKYYPNISLIGCLYKHAKLLYYYIKLLYKVARWYYYAHSVDKEDY